VKLQENHQVSACCCAELQREKQFVNVEAWLEGRGDDDSRQTPISCRNRRKFPTKLGKIAQAGWKMPEASDEMKKVEKIISKLSLQLRNQTLGRLVPFHKSQSSRSSA
jgi:hypothetical protein